jgi:hypothetical protein
MSGFNLKDAGDKPVQASFQKPGIYENVKVVDVLLEKSSQKQVLYLKLVTSGQNGETGYSTKMFLSTTVGEGKKTSAWSITARNLADLICATHNIEDAKAKEMIAVETVDQLVSKVSALLVGRPFRAKFKGEEGSNGNGTIFASLDRVESMQIAAENTNLRFDAARDIKKYEGPVMTSPANAPKKEVDQDALPF